MEKRKSVKPPRSSKWYDHRPPTSTACFASPVSNISIRGKQRFQKATSRRSLPRCATSSLPAWEREYEQERGLVGTSYETATVEEVTPVGSGCLRIVVDTAVTCTAQQYLSEGQFLFLKPWGDEDGSIEPACFTTAPGGGAMLPFFVPEHSAVGAAALAGEMLEVSEVMGAGFAPVRRRAAFADKQAVVGVCAALFCAPVLLALRDDARPATIVVAGARDGPFAGRAAEWARARRGRVVTFCDDVAQVAREVAACVAERQSVAVLLCADAEVCRAAAAVVARGGDGKDVEVFAP